MGKLMLGIVAAIGRVGPVQPRDRAAGDGRPEAPREEHLRLALFGWLVQRARWLLGTGLSMLGWPLQVIALLLAPLVVVQPALAAGLLVLLLLAERMLGEHAGRSEHVAMLAIVIGVVGAGVFAPSARHRPWRGADDRRSCWSGSRSRACCRTCCARSGARSRT